MRRKNLTMIILGLFILLTPTVYAQSLIEAEKFISSEWLVFSAEGMAVEDSASKPDYVDGTSSASKLRARRSHSVSGQDEAGLTIFLGIIVIAVIVVLLKPFSETK